MLARAAASGSANIWCPLAGPRLAEPQHHPSFGMNPSRVGVVGGFLSVLRGFILKILASWCCGIGGNPSAAGFSDVVVWCW